MIGVKVDGKCLFPALKIAWHCGFRFRELSSSGNGEVDVTPE